jgi:hypothetical protein
VVDVLSKAYFTLSEGRPFLMMAITKILYSRPDQIEQDVNLSELEVIINQGIQIWNNHSYLTKLLSGDYQFTIPDFAADMHTREGKRMGKNRSNFVREGALVTNQNSIYYDSMLERIYNES